MLVVDGYIGGRILNIMLGVRGKGSLRLAMSAAAISYTYTVVIYDDEVNMHTGLGRIVCRYGQ